MYDKGVGSPPQPLGAQILFQMFDFYFHSWVDEVFSTYLKSEFWGLKLSSSRRAQTGVECVRPESKKYLYMMIDARDQTKPTLPTWQGKQIFSR